MHLGKWHSQRSAFKTLTTMVLTATLVLSGLAPACAEEAADEPVSEAITESAGAAAAGDANVAGESAGDTNAASLAEATLSSLTTRQKLAQMIGIRFDSWYDDAAGETVEDAVAVTELNEELQGALSRNGFGLVTLFGSNVQTNVQLKALTDSIQEAVTGAESTDQIPAFIAIDQEGGYIVRMTDGTTMPGNMALGATGDPANATQAASVIASELSAAGISVDFAPDADVNNNPSNPVIGVRSFGSDAALVSDYVAAYTEGLLSGGIVSCLKHFPGHGDTGTDSHTGFPLIDKSPDELRAQELLPFAAGIEAGTQMIMTAHIQYPQIETTTYTSVSTGEEVTLPATMSKTILTDILRGELGFEGIIITDAMGMGALADNFDPLDAAVTAINAGVDILLCPYPYNLYCAGDITAAEAFLDQLTACVEDGTIDEATVDTAVTRILTLKYESGLMGGDEAADETAAADADVSEEGAADGDAAVSEEAAADADTDDALAQIGSAEHHAIEREITEKAITLVKNDGDTLPFDLSAGNQVLILYPDEYRGASVSLALTWLEEDGITDEADIVALNYAGMTAEDYAEDIAGADHILILTRMNSLNDLNPETSLETSNGRFVRDAIALAHENGKQAAVLSVHLPYDIAAYTEADALVCAYNNRTASAASEAAVAAGETAAYGPNVPTAVCMAFGTAPFSGTLPVDVPVLAEDYTFTDEILYPVGTGITTGAAE